MNINIFSLMQIAQARPYQRNNKVYKDRYVKPCYTGDTEMALTQGVASIVLIT